MTIQTTITLDNGRCYNVDVQPTTAAQLRIAHPHSRAKLANLVTFRLRTEDGSWDMREAPSRLSSRAVFATNFLTGICTRDAFIAAGGDLSGLTD